MDMSCRRQACWQVQDAETGKTKWVTQTVSSVRKHYHDEFFRVTAYATEIFKKQEATC